MGRGKIIHFIPRPSRFSGQVFSSKRRGEIEAVSKVFNHEGLKGLHEGAQRKIP